MGGFDTEEDAKTALDEARVKARRGEYVDRNAITVAEYLGQWLDSHAIEIKPGTLEDYRIGIRLYVTPHIGGMKLQAVRPSAITKLYRDLLTGGGQNGKPLSVATVVHTHAILRRAFRDAVIVDQLIDNSPVERAKRPRARISEPGTVWTPAQLRTFLAVARRHRSPSSTSPPTRAPGGATAQSPLGGRRPRRQADHHHRLGRRGRGRASGGHNEKRPDANRQHR